MGKERNRRPYGKCSSLHAPCHGSLCTEPRLTCASCVNGLMCLFICPAGEVLFGRVRLVLISGFWNVYSRTVTQSNHNT